MFCTFLVSYGVCHEQEFGCTSKTENQCFNILENNYYFPLSNALKNITSVL